MAAQVDIVITACTFTPVPSLSAMVASYFEMRSDVLHYSLGGQGCTSGIIEVELAAHLLRVRCRAGPGVVAFKDVGCSRRWPATLTRAPKCSTTGQGCMSGIMEVELAADLKQVRAGRARG